MRAMLVLLSVVTVSSPMSRDRVIATKASLTQYARSIAEFERLCGRLPTPEEGLDMLIHQPADWPGQIPWTPFLEVSTVPRDAWGNRFIYVLDPELAEGFGIYSCGRDGMSFSNGNDRDDLNTWSRERPWLACYEDRMNGVDVRSCAIGLGITLLVVAASVALWKAAKSENRPA